jgi:thymidylate synthase
MKYGIKIVANNFNELFINAIYNIHVYGKENNPRGFVCKEIIAPQLILTNPKRCLITIKDRRLNYKYLIIEKMMYLSGVQYPEILIAYNGKMEGYLNKSTGLIDGAYGPRINQGNQLNHCYELLMEDKDSRQAVITINDWTDRKKSLDKPCTLSLQFLIRDGKLDMITTMRSNDIMWGLCLDIPAFCFIQEVMAYWLNVEIGNYIHQPASLHWYNNFEKQLLSFLKLSEQKNDMFILDNLNVLNDETFPDWTIPKQMTDNALELFWLNETKLRENKECFVTGFDTIDNYLLRLSK